MLTRIISGCQTGADQGALFAAETLGLPTGGWMPRGYRTDEGFCPDFAKRFNIQEHSSSSYVGRTWQNVFYADGTLIIGNIKSPGCVLTRRYTKELRKPCYLITWPEDTFLEEDYQFRYWLHTNDISVLNVAGNRERNNKGIFEATKQFLIRNLKEC